MSQPDHHDEQKETLVQQRFGAVAEAYVTSTVHAQGPDLAWIVEEAALTGQELVLDVGTGTGHTALALAPTAREVIALDITTPMLEAAKRLASERHVTNIRFEVGDAQALPYTSESIDLVVCRKAAHHFYQVPQAVREWARVVKPGGKVLLVDSISPEEPEIDQFLHEIESLRDPSHVRNYRISEWLALFQAEGLTAHVEREWGITMDVPTWTERMKTPAESVEKIVQMMTTAPAATQERLGIENREGVFWFSLPTALIVATK